MQTIDTTCSLLARWMRRPAILSQRVRCCIASAKAWERRADAYARIGEYRAADNCESEAISLYQLADEYREEQAIARATR